MRKFKLIILLFIAIILCGCNSNNQGGNLNVGYNTPKLENFQINFNLYTINEKEESFILKSKEIPSYKFQLLRIDETHVYLGIKIDDILARKNTVIHKECVIYGDNNNEQVKTTYTSTNDLYIAIYQNNNGPWSTIDKKYSPAILINTNDAFETFTTNLNSFNAVLTQE